ncbi:Rho GTPase activation protein, partial [Cryphonectria parasitica EP155]
SFFNNLRREGGRVAESIGKGLFGKGGRSASTTERDLVDDEHYVLKVINLPLVEQTRLTRISKRLEESRDKTEFWMPAFPWRAIDYLNYKGCDVEGLYRVPGSGPQVKKWQRRFDEQYDVDLFQQDDLYDINIIGSMLKAWLRELPDELFPKEAQDRVARECAGSEKVPQLLIDELSSLSPFNYYLLFAITCHLSLLLAHSDKNKMDFRNLCICFQPCMKIDAFCFKFLVCDWRDCWKGCKTEGRYIEEEYKLFDQPPPPGLGVRKKLEPRLESRDERRRSPGLDRDERER